MTTSDHGGIPAWLDRLRNGAELHGIHYEDCGDPEAHWACGCKAVADVYAAVAALDASLNREAAASAVRSAVEGLQATPPQVGAFEYLGQWWQRGVASAGNAALAALLDTPGGVS